MMSGSGGMSGAGLGSFLISGAKKLAMPMAKRALATASKTALREGTKAVLGITSDALAGRNIKQAAQARGRQALKRTASRAFDSAMAPYAKRLRVQRGKKKTRPQPRKKKNKKLQRGRGISQSRKRRWETAVMRARKGRMNRRR